ncbi:hypothetical protein [Microbacterium sp. NPDC089188]|uniref:hypothetical protein n=1 Tax=Microbacterium sp. NPDC089188 TaxID=3154971 RepID=UPI0034333FDB
MAVFAEARLLTSAAPRPVQILLNGVAAGTQFEVVGTTADGARWNVPGGVGRASGTQVVLIDNRPPLNTSVVYEVTVGRTTYLSNRVFVEFSGPALVQVLDGRDLVAVEVATLTEKRAAGTRSSAFEIAGRSDPALRLDVPGSFAYSWELDTQGRDSVVMERILRTGRPIVRRLEPGMRDLKTVVIGVVTGWSDELVQEGLDTWRRWSLSVREIADPQPSTPLVLFSWDDFDAAMSSRVWSASEPAVRTFDETFDTWDQFDAADWSLL